jgi:hypothetical protein
MSPGQVAPSGSLQGHPPTPFKGGIVFAYLPQVTERLQKRLSGGYSSRYKRRLDRDTMWVILGDHGEAFGQHEGNFGHTLFVYEERSFLLTYPVLRMKI